jgi:phage-related baseplate assembly protein
MGFCITALLKILPNQESGQILINAKKSLDDGLKELRKIGETITLSEINKFLKVDGVKEVIITEPPENIAVQNHQIGVNSGTNTITTTTI